MSKTHDEKITEGLAAADAGNDALAEHNQAVIDGTKEGYVLGIGKRIEGDLMPPPRPKPLA